MSKKYFIHTYRKKSDEMESSSSRNTEESSGSSGSLVFNTKKNKWVKSEIKNKTKP